MDSFPFLSKVYFNNTLLDYTIAFSIALGGIVLIAAFKRLLIGRIKRLAASTESKIDDLIVAAFERFGIPIARWIMIYWGLSYLTFPSRLERVIDVGISVVVAFFILRLASSSMYFLLHAYISKQENGETKLKQISSLMIVVNIVIWTLGAIFLFDNLGFNVSAILTGVGIGGIAIALAAQNIIGDLFNYFVIFFDKPFEVGDSIVVDDKNGTIEFIGLKTTRLRSITGEQIVLANSDLTKSRVHNFKRLEVRRVAFTISVTYHATQDQLRRIPAIIKEIVLQTNATRFDRVHFSKFGEYGLAFEIVYFVLSSDYLKYMDIQESINLRIIEAFSKNNIQFLIREDRPGVWGNAASSP
ncbi:MAG TPA: mechanosensitive ion channel family protein [Cyclobacteriaceae bacterium]|nr:mechanosensitive ion channel family protein [Cyclobacteriaceae bacterium]